MQGLYASKVLQRRLSEESPKHRKDFKIRAAELRNEALPPAQEDCSICFLPMPFNLLSCISLPPATISSVPICDYAEAKELADMDVRCGHLLSMLWEECL